MYDDGSENLPERSEQTEPLAINERLIELETKIAFQEQTIAQLNDQMYAQQNIIDKLDRTVTDLSNRFKAALTDLELDDTQSPVNADLEKDVPPHY